MPSSPSRTSFSPKHTVSTRTSWSSKLSMVYMTQSTKYCFFAIPSKPIFLISASHDCTTNSPVRGLLIAHTAEANLPNISKSGMFESEFCCSKKPLLIIVGDWKIGVFWYSHLIKFEHGNLIRFNMKFLNLNVSHIRSKFLKISPTFLTFSRDAGLMLKFTGLALTTLRWSCISVNCHRRSHKLTNLMPPPPPHFLPRILYPFPGFLIDHSVSGQPWGDTQYSQRPELWKWTYHWRGRGSGMCIDIIWGQWKNDSQFCEVAIRSLTYIYCLLKFFCLFLIITC